MRKTALILAGAAVFDLGVMAVSAQAQQQVQPPPPSPAGPAGLRGGFIIPSTGVAEDPGACAQGKHIPAAQLSACRGAAPDNPTGPVGQAAAVDMFLKIDRVNTVQACAARRGTVVTRDGSQQCRIPADGAGSASGRPPTDAAPRGRIMSELSTMEVEIFIKIDAVNTVQACTARRGEIVRHEGVQQCRLPAPAGSPNLRAAPNAGPGDSDIHKQGLSLNFMKIDVDYTARACVAQRGEVVTHEGVQRCRLPGDPGDIQPSSPRR